MGASDKKKAQGSASKLGIKVGGKGKTGGSGAENKGKGANKKRGSSSAAVKHGKKGSAVANATLPAHVPAGTSTLPMDNAAAKGFKVGQKVRIGNDQFAEDRFVIGFGSLILDRPLEFPHAAGEVITVVKASAKEIKTFHHRELRLYIRSKVIDVTIARAAGLGEQIVSSRRKQNEFESRCLRKPMF